METKLPPVFDPQTAPLFGVNLIEAGAGTGKTYTIASLVLRLLLETDIRIDQILVVTFTEAATDELRGRLYERIGSSLLALQNTESINDIAAHQQAINRLQQASHGFDEAGIFTIHGFCRRVLQENALESAIQFETQLIENEPALFQEIVADFWRKSFYETETSPIKRALKNYIRQTYSRDNLLELVKKYSNQLFLQLSPSAPADPDWQALNQCNENMTQQLADLSSSWQAHKDDICAILLDNPNLNRVSYKRDKIPDYCQAIDQYLAAQTAHNIPDCFHLFCQKNINDKTKKGKEPPKHAFFALAQIHLFTQTQIKQAFEQAFLAWQHQAFHYCQTERSRRIRQRGQYAFNDLLNDVYLALQGQGKTVLTERLQQSYHAVLIDEFQDTDMLQYQIFSSLFQAPAQQAEQNRSLFFIGDPKQAIYAFRSADIFTYISAAQQVDKRYTLTTNWRSQAHLLTAINAIFTKHPQPFLLEQIQYHPLQAAKAADESQHQALQIHYLDRAILGCDPTKPLTAEAIEHRIPHLLAQEILQQLQQDSSLSPGDMAVLVPSNQQAIDIQAALQKQGLPVVLYSKQSLFSSHEALEMQFVLAAVLDPHNEDGLRAALATDLLGLSATELAELPQNTLAWEMWSLRFRDYRQTWQQRGFYLMAYQLMQDVNMSVRLLSLLDGERRLTNVLHLIEVLHQAQQQGQGIRYLLQWLHERCALAIPEQDTYLLRLESDAQAIKVSTIHKSKGLQYPIVFLPYAWKGASAPKVPFIYHKNQDPKQVYLQLNSDKTAQKTAFQEKAAENLRLFYVALTRAERCCHLFWGAHNTQYNPLAYLLGFDAQYSKQNDKNLIQQLQQTLPLTEVKIQPLQRHQHPPYRPSASVEKVLAARRFERSVSLPWQIISFSALLKQQQHQFDARQQPAGVDALYTHQTIHNEDQQPEPDNKTVMQASIELPASAHMGNLLHEILQYLDFQQPDFTHIGSKLQTYGYDIELQKPLIALLETVLQTPLNTNGLQLNQLAKAQRLNEVEFFYPINHLDAITFNKILQSYPLARYSAQLEFKQIHGFMRGFIDLIFYWQGKYYILDYKSNRLGFGLDDYQQTALRDTMQQHHYVLQYLIYSVALQQYLKNRLPDYDSEQHFGGIYYLFLRGMQPSQSANYGVFFDRPPADFIEQLSKLLIHH